SGQRSPLQHVRGRGGRAPCAWGGLPEAGGRIPTVVPRHGGEPDAHPPLSPGGAPRADAAGPAHGPVRPPRPRAPDRDPNGQRPCTGSTGRQRPRVSTATLTP